MQFLIETSAKFSEKCFADRNLFYIKKKLVLRAYACKNMLFLHCFRPKNQYFGSRMFRKLTFQLKPIALHRVCIYTFCTIYVEKKWICSIKNLKKHVSFVLSYTKRFLNWIFRPCLHVITSSVGVTMEAGILVVS